MRFGNFRRMLLEIALPGGSEDGLKMLPAFVYSKEW